MREIWRIGVGVDLRVTEREAIAPPGGEELPPHHATAWVRWAKEDGVRGQRLLLEMSEALTGEAATPRTSMDAAERAVERGIADGRLRVYSVKHNEGGGKAPEKKEPKSNRPPPVEDKTFVAIQLLTDEAEPQPVPFKRYRIELPDHSVREGQLDQLGKAQITGIDPGTCKVSFPDFDAADWKAA